MANSDIYRQEILEHYRHPQNFGKLKKPDARHLQSNPMCGDDLELQITMQKGRIKDARFNGSGCALSVASASLATEWMKGKTAAQLKKLRPGQIVKAMNIKIGPARRKCVLLVYDALQGILKNEKIANIRKTK